MIDNHKSILLALSRGDITRLDVTEITGLSEYTLQRLMPELIDLDYIRKYKTERSLTFWTLTHEGINAISRIRSNGYAGDIVKPRTINKLIGVYRPSVTAYYRNNGNKHIGSVGVAC